MAILNLIQQKGMQFFDRHGHNISKRGFYGIVRPGSPIMSIDDFNEASFDSLFQAFRLDPEREHKLAFAVVDGKIQNLDIYVIDLLLSRDYDKSLVNNLAMARGEFSFFDVEKMEEVMVK